MLDKEKIIEICAETNSMSEAANKAGIDRRKFVILAKECGCYKPNMGGKGIKKNKPPSIPIKDIFNGIRSLTRWQFKNRLIKEGYKENKCEECGISTWNGKPLSIQLHHKDGNKNNNKLNNLEFLCPNCHSQTETFSGRNKKM